MFKYVAVLAILSVTSQMVFAQNEIYDNVSDFANYIFNGLADVYYQQNGIIPIPDHKKLSNGFFGNLSQIQRLDDVWIRAAPASVNPRPVTFKFNLIGATAFYNNYRFSLIAQRTLQYSMDLGFAVEFEIEVNDVCRVILKKVEVDSKSDVYNENVTGGIIPAEALKGIVRLVASRNSDVVVEAVRADIEEKVKYVLGDETFDCGFYGPTQMFYPPAPVDPTPNQV